MGRRDKQGTVIWGTRLKEVQRAAGSQVMSCFSTWSAISWVWALGENSLSFRARLCTFLSVFYFNKEFT